MDLNCGFKLWIRIVGLNCGFKLYPCRAPRANGPSSARAMSVEGECCGGQGWSECVQDSLAHRHHLYGDVMWVVRRGCEEIMRVHRARQTECFYEKMLACYLYERGIPYMTQVIAKIFAISLDAKFRLCL